MSDASDSEHHEDLLAAVRKLDSTKPARRKRAGVALAEEGDGKQVTAAALVAGLSSTRQLDDLKKSLKQSNRKHRTLEAPLHNNVKSKLERQLAYKSVRGELDKWKDIVKANRLAEHLEFPLNQEAVKPKTASERIGQCQPRTPLEIETAKILGSSPNNLRSGELLTAAEQEMIKAMSLSEAKQRLSELRKARLLLSSRESKFRRWKKIKSKQFHRRLKKQKHKELLKEFEELKTKDPEAALEKLELLERDRVQERASLRHRGTGKWAKGLRKQAKNNPELREQLAQHYRDGKDRAEKQAADSDDSSADDSGSEIEGDNIEKLLDGLDDEPDGESTETHDQFLLSLRDASAAKKNPWLKANLSKVKASDKTQSHAHADKPADAEPLVPLDDNWDGLPSTSAAPTEEVEVVEPEPGSKKSRKKRKRSSRPSDMPEDAPHESPTVDSSGDQQSKKLCKSDKSLEPPDQTSAKKRKKFKKKSNSKERPSAIEPSTDTMFDNLQEELISATKRTLQQQTRRAARQTKGAAAGDEDEEELLLHELDQMSDVELPDSDKDEEDADGDQDLIVEGLDRVHTLQEADKLLEKNPDPGASSKKSKPQKRAKKKAAEESLPTEANVDPRKLLLQDEQSVDPNKLIHVAPELIESIDASHTQQQSALLAEAFAGDDVIAEFEAAKKSAEEEEKPKDVDLTLPGWGDWAGHKIDPNSAKMKRKRQRFTIKAPDRPPRRDSKLGNVIISEKAKSGSAIRKLQVSELPFPYKSVADFERSVRQPIGPEWNTYSGHQSLTQPRVRTATGRIIRPMNKQVTFTEHATREQSDSD